MNSAQDKSYATHVYSYNGVSPVVLGVGENKVGGFNGVVGTVTCFVCSLDIQLIETLFVTF